MKNNMLVPYPFIMDLAWGSILDICECVNEPITPPSCDDEDCTTNDYYDTDICEYVNEPITPPRCDDND